MSNLLANYRWLYYLPALVWAIIIYSASTNTPPELPKFDLISLDKVGHFACYCILVVLIGWGYAKHLVINRLPFILLPIIWLGASLYGMMIEFVQATLPNRQFDYADMLANCIGAFLGIGIAVWIAKRLKTT